jgi:hypothetical protein
MSFRASMENGIAKSFLGICNIWPMASKVTVNMVFLEEETMALWLGQ